MGKDKPYLNSIKTITFPGVGELSIYVGETVIKNIDEDLWELTSDIPKDNKGIEIINQSTLEWVKQNLKLKNGQSGEFTWRNQDYEVTRIKNKYYLI